jgi:hypothetical protein
VFVAIGLLLLAVGLGSVALRLARGNLLGVPAMIFEAALAVLGALALLHGLRSLVKPAGK